MPGKRKTTGSYKKPVKSSSGDGGNSSSETDSGKINLDTTNGKSNKIMSNSSKVGYLRKHNSSSEMEQKNIVLWKHPIITLRYFLLESFYLSYEFFEWLLHHYKLTLFIIFDILMITLVCHLDGPHKDYVSIIKEKVIWSSYWIGLGILSSVGLGTGLHTFLLYLGPHIASVTLAAYECGSLNFPEPPYPEEIVCPSESENFHISIFDIMRKVRLEAFMWGAGTALGELPPYFMARASRLSGKTLKELEDSIENGHELQSNHSPHFLERLRESIRVLVEKVGFFGILACASIPNPLFDLAGITCGHFLIPFWTFFGATLIGKAIIKMHIQKLFVIVAFSEHHVETSVDLIRQIPHIGKYLTQPFREFLVNQKASLHRKAGTPYHKHPSWLAWIFEKLVTGMIIYFLISLINSMAQNYVNRWREQRQYTSKCKLAKD